MTVVTRRYRFSSSHRLHTDVLSESANCALYGKCNNPYGHGHDYVLDISVRGPIDPATGRVADITALDRFVGEQVLAAFDRRDLNAEIPAFARTPPTSENMVLEIRRRLCEGWDREFGGLRPELAGIRLEETRRNSFELREP